MRLTRLPVIVTRCTLPDVSGVVGYLAGLPSCTRPERWGRTEEEAMLSLAEAMDAHSYDTAGRTIAMAE